MRILIVAPAHPDLPDQPQEVADLKAVLDAVVATNGEKTLMAVINNAKFDGVWISSHANSEYIQLEGNERLDAAGLAQYLQAVDAKWVVINSCEGYEFVDKLQGYYPCDVVAASVKTLGDRPAWRTAALIARSLRETKDLHKALRLASPRGAAPYRFWPNPTHENNNEPMSTSALAQLQTEALGLRADLQKWQREIERETDDRYYEAKREGQDTLRRLVGLEGKVGVVEELVRTMAQRAEKDGDAEPVFSQVTIKQTVVGIYLIGFLLLAILVTLIAIGRPL